MHFRDFKRFSFFCAGRLFVAQFWFCMADWRRSWWDQSLGACLECHYDTFDRVRCMDILWYRSVSICSRSMHIKHVKNKSWVLGPIFTKSVISYWNPCFWLVISRVLTEFCHLWNGSLVKHLHCERIWKRLEQTENVTVCSTKELMCILWGFKSSKLRENLLGLDESHIRRNVYMGLHKHMTWQFGLSNAL